MDAKNGGLAQNMPPHIDILALQKHVAQACLTSSSLRNQGGAGVLASARLILGRCRLSLFAEKACFFERLDARTNYLRKKLPAKCQHFGTARKALNLFIRDCFYNQYLCRRYKLKAISHLLELPMDKDAYVFLAARHSDIPKWVGIKRMSKRDHQKYQAAALATARQLNTFRVHLDILSWRAKYKH